MLDETYRRDVWNDTAEPRVIRLVQVERPVRGAGRLMADFFMGTIRRSPFVREARRKIARFQEAVNASDQET